MNVARYLSNDFKWSLCKSFVISQLQEKEGLKPSYPEKGEVEIYDHWNYLRQGKYYKVALYTRKTGMHQFKNEKYYTTEPMEYIGKYVAEETVSPDSSKKVRRCAVFDNNFKITKIYLREGSCFLKCECIE